MRDYVITPNQRNVTIKITRGELCRLLTACSALIAAPELGNCDTWKALHDKLAEQLNKHDQLYREEYKI